MKRTLVLTSPHMTGDDVKYAQRVLRKHGGYYEGKADGEYGPLTAQAAYRAQYWMGYTTPKQTFGTALEKLLLGQAKPSGAQQKRIAERKKAAGSKPLREKALAAMGKFVGLTEVPPGTVTVVIKPTRGTATVVAGHVRYTPLVAFTGTDTLRYTVCSRDRRECTEATVRVTVTG